MLQKNNETLFGMILWHSCWVTCIYSVVVVITVMVETCSVILCRVEKDLGVLRHWSVTVTGLAWVLLQQSTSTPFPTLFTLASTLNIPWHNTTCHALSVIVYIGVRPNHFATTATLVIIHTVINVPMLGFYIGNVAQWWIHKNTDFLVHCK